MFKRGLIALICLTVMSAALAWAASFQLQTKLVNAGGTLTVGTATQSTVGQLVLTNSSVTIPVTVNVSGGYKLSALTKNGVNMMAFSNQSTGYNTTFAPGVTVQSLTATFAKKAVLVSTPLGVSPVNPSSSIGGTVLMTVSPTGTNNQIQSVSVTNATLQLTDFGGNIVTPTAAAPYTGSLKAKISAITGNVVVTAVYGIDPRAAMVKACATCHAGSSTPAVVAVQSNWEGSNHADSNVTCVTCHVAMPGTVVTATVAAGTFKALRNFTTSINGTKVAVKKDSNFCANCHATGALPDDKHSAAMKNDCSACHTFDAHSLARTAVATTVAAKHAGTSETCSTCHTNQIVDFATANNPHVAKVGGHFTQGCAGCHVEAIVTNASTTVCTTCHKAPYGAQAVAWAAGLHNIANNTFEQIGCADCHNAHAPMTGKGNVELMLDGKTDSCAACHLDKRGQFPGAGNYSIYTSASMLVKKAPHGGGKFTINGAVNVGDNITQYVGQGAICQDCHGHNNSINAGFAEGGHGKVSSDPLNAFAHYDWSGRTNNGTRQNGNCDRCHTAAGFIKFTNQDAALATRLAPVPNTPANVLICVACHTNLDTGALRTAAVPAGDHGPLSGGYFALFSSAAGTVADNKTKIEISFPGYKNSSICIPCHSGRSTAAVFVAVIDQAKLANKNYTTINTNYYQHAANMGQTFISQGGYDLSGKLATIVASPHSAVKMGATDTQGPCVGCHYSAAGTHSLEVAATSPTCLAAACHTNAPDVVTAKANFFAGVAALDTLIRAKFAPLQTVAGDLSTERANVRFGRFGKAAGVAADDATAKKAYGAWYNWQILTTYDNAAWAHNPRYARQILNDTIQYLALDGATASSSQAGRDAIAAAITANSATPAAATAATSFLVAPGCAACHAGVVTAFTTQAGFHFADHKYACANCHSETHITGALPTCSCHGDNATTHPTRDAQTAALAVSATTGACATCHATNDVHSMKAASASGKGCVDCHLGALTHTGGKTADNNNGVRAIIPEFQKTSHHIYNGPTALPTDAQCAVCHLEGQVVGSAIVMDPAFHMKDAKIHLRNSDTDADFAWDPMAAAPDHAGMDTYCFSCHDANGATSTKIAGIQAIIKTANPAALATPATQINAANPFGDLLSNKYDQVTRAQVVDVDSAFTGTNASHHAVKAPKYTIKTTSAAMAAVGQKTLFDGGLFVSDYTPLGAAVGNTVADNSQLHCGDCHTVGQWKNDNTKYNKAAIGAHGSVNEYMLRNNLGTDALHDGTTYVCFNCHNDKAAASATSGGYYAGFNAAGASPVAVHAQGIHAGTNGDFQNTAGLKGNSGLVSVTKTSATATTFNADGSVLVDGGRLGGNVMTVASVRSSKGTSQGNITGISCTNCHNAGLRSGFGGIHGGNATYSSKGIVAGNLGSATESPARFMSGMGNFQYVPASNDLNNVTNPNKPAASVQGTCYTNALTTDNAGYSSCNHHAAGTTTGRVGGSVGNVARPLSY